jgi:hypothetical protein
MSTIRATKNPENKYAITVGNNYDVLKEGSEHFFIRNDKNHVVKYSKKLFTVAENAEQVPQAAPRPAPAPRRLTEQQMINTVVANAEGDVTFQNRNREEVRFESSLVYDDSQGITISCGIGQITGFLATGEALNDLMNDTFEEDYEELRKTIFTASLRAVLAKANQRGIVLMSSNLDGTSAIYYDILNEISNNSSASVHNPNSGNTIKLWMFYVNQP